MTVTDVLPAGLTLVRASVVSGSFTLVTTTGSVTAVAPTMGTGTAVISLTVDVGVGAVGTITNVANVASSVVDTIQGNNRSTATTAILGADLAIFKFGPPSITAAGTATYTLVIANYGPSVAVNVTVTDVMPTGLSLLRAEASRRPAAWTLQHQPRHHDGRDLRAALVDADRHINVHADYTATGTVTNIATVTSTVPDICASNNSTLRDMAIKEVEPGVILVNKTGNKTVAEVADSVQYTIRMRNTIALPVNRITLEDLLPAGFRYIPGTSRLNGVAVPDPAAGKSGASLSGTSAPFRATRSTSSPITCAWASVRSRATASTARAAISPVHAARRSVPTRRCSRSWCRAASSPTQRAASLARSTSIATAMRCSPRMPMARSRQIPGVRLVMLDGTYS